VRWEAAPSANGPLAYTVTLDGRRLPTPAGTFALRIDPRGLGDGTHSVQVLASDIYGQSTLSASSPLRVAGRPPAVAIAVRGRSVRVTVIDRYAGINARRVSVAFGDGQGGARRKAFRHRYRHAGLYTIVVRSADRLGNAGVVRKVVSVR
jgi:hypothetical protein